MRNILEAREVPVYAFSSLTCNNYCCSRVKIVGKVCALQHSDSVAVPSNACHFCFAFWQRVSSTDMRMAGREVLLYTGPSDALSRIAWVGVV